MYPDPITPRSHPDLLQRPSYDPFGVMPAAIPDHHRVFATPRAIERTRRRIADKSPIDVAALAALEAAADRSHAPGEPFTKPTHAQFASTAFLSAAAFTLTRSKAHHARALEAIRSYCRAVAVADWHENESQIVDIACAYDLLAAEGLAPADDNLVRDFLWVAPSQLDKLHHPTCNNHNSFNMLGRLAAGAALGHRPTIHDALYGLQRGNTFRYGYLHLLRHDFLPDGVQWEGSMSYHMLVLCSSTEMNFILEALGIDMWAKTLPSLQQNDGFDEHRCYHRGGAKSLRGAIDAYLYQAFPNGDYSNLHDQILGNVRGSWVWGPALVRAWETWRDPRHAWLLNRIEREHPAAPGDPRPVWARAQRAEALFVRIESREIPPGKFSFNDDADISLTGKHRGGCSLFPSYGSAMLRATPDSETSPAVMLYFGPHAAGHRSPACLHIDVHAAGQRITHAPHLYQRGYDEPLHLTWVRSTVAHNTLCVDHAPMSPFDFETNSLWECDLWRDTITDGVLELFQPEPGFKAVRASNPAVYKGVNLERTLVLTPDYLIDLFRAESDGEHTYDLATHIIGALPRPADATPITLGATRGYRHFTHAVTHPARAGWVTLPISRPKIDPAAQPFAGSLSLLIPETPDASLILADDPPPDQRTPIGDRAKPEPRATVILRAKARAARFLSVWSFKPSPPVVEALPDHRVKITDAGVTTIWSLAPGKPVSRG